MRLACCGRDYGSACYDGDQPTVVEKSVRQCDDLHAFFPLNMPP
jgi:hypothetical protein